VKLKGSCHCGAVRFELESAEPVPYMRCYCSICRKTNGGGGYAINLGGTASTLVVEGRDSVSIYRAKLPDGSGGTRESRAERNFCRHCGSGLWLFSPEWPELVHPFASAIDTELPAAPQLTHIMLDSKAGWVPLTPGAGDTGFPGYPDESLADWHRRHGFAAAPAGRD
jgi:hypothetical protein